MKSKTKNKVQQQKTKAYMGKQQRQQQRLQKQQHNKILLWARQVSQHPQFYHPEKQDSDSYQYYHILIQSLKKVQLNSSRRKAFLQFTVIPYDSQKASFIGRTQFTDIIELDQHASRSVIQCGKSIYIYTSHERLAVRICLWKLDCEKNGKGGELVNKRTFLGQFDVHIGSNGESGQVVKELLQSENKSLFIDQHRTAENQNEKQQNSSKSQVIYKVLNTHSLSFLRYFVPSDYLCDSNTTILGLKGKRIQENGQIVIDERSKLRLQLRSLALPRAIIKRVFQVAQQKVSLSNEIIGLPKSSLKDIILHVQYHNGWKSVCQESLVLIQNTNQSMLVSKQMIAESKMKVETKNKSILKKTNKINDSQTGNRTFSYDKMKELTAVFTQDGGALLYWLQAKIQVGFEVPKSNKEKNMKTEIVYLPVAFCIKPVNEMDQEQLATFELKLGNPYNLGNLSKYLQQLTQQKETILLQKQQKITCEVMFYLLKGKGGMEAMTNNLQKQAQQVEELKVQKQKLARLKRKLREEKRKRLIELNQQIPFLDPSKLKAELYQQKIQQLQSQKQEKQDQLFFLKAKIAQLQRVALKNRLQNQEDEDQEHSYGVDVVKQLPQNFQDYKAEEIKVDLANQETIIQDNTSFCKKASKAPNLASKIPSIEQWCSTKTYLNIRIIKLQALIEGIENFSFGVQNTNGSLQFSDGFTVNYQQQEHKSINLLLSTSTLESLHRLIESLLNGFLPVYVICNKNTHLRGMGLADIGPLFQQLQLHGIHSSQLRSRVQFKQENTSLCELQVVFSFTQTYQNEQKPSDNIVQTERKGEAEEKLSFRSRIDRFKELNNIQNTNASKKAVIQKAFSALKVQRHEVPCSFNKPSHLKLRFTNLTQNAKRFQIVIADEDSAYLQQPQLKIQLPSNLHSFKRIQEEITQQKDVLELAKGNEAELVAIYISKRQLFRDIYKTSIQKDKSLYQRFNHSHKITIRVLQMKSRVVQKVFQLAIIPQLDSYNLVVQKFLCDNSKAIVMPIPTHNLALESDLSVNSLPTRIILSFPSTNQPKNGNNLSLLKLFKLLGNLKVLFFEFQLWLRKCVRQQVSTRLWQQQDILLKVPIEQILKAEINLGHQITSLQITSKHIDFKIRTNNQYQHFAVTNFSKKNNQIYLRGKLQTSAVGKQTYPVLISDQFGNIFYTIALSADIPFPSLTPPQIISLKIPHHDLEQLQQFAFTNKTGYLSTFRVKSLRPHLVQIIQKEKQLKKDESWQINIRFNWKRITEELQSEEMSQCSCLLGIMNGFVIEYVLFRCREK